MANINNVGIPLPRHMPLNCRNRKTRWEEFKAEFNDYAIFTDLYDESEEKQMTAFRLYLGPHWRSKLKMLTLPKLREKVAGKATPLLIATAEALDKEFGSSQNVLVLRERFYNFQQGDLDTEAFLYRLYEMAAECEFPADFRDEMIRDRIVFGIQNRATKDRLMSAEKIDLSSVLATVRRLVDSKKRNLEEDVSGVNVVRRSTGRKKGSPTEPDCGFCGLKHSRDRQQCPASGKICKGCGKKGHFRKMCRLSKGNKVHQLGYSSDDNSVSDDDDQYSTESAYAVREGRPTTFKSIKITLIGETEKRRFPLEAQIDTGASCNVLPYHLYKELARKNLIGSLEKSRVRLQMYNGNITPSLGRCSIICHNGPKQAIVQFEVARVTELPLLSASSSMMLGCIRLGEGVEFINKIRDETKKPNHQRKRLEKLIEKYGSVFEGLGKLPGTVSIHLKEECKPIQCLPRKVPVAIREQVTKRILELEKLGVIQRIKNDVPSPWISQMLVVTREGKKPRITLDPFHLNQATRRCHFRMPTLSDILPHLNKTRFFTVCDAADGFYQCVLDKDSTDCTAFWTPLGRFKYLRMQQGLNIAPEIYQAKQMEILEGLKGVYCVADDLLITGSGDSDEEAWSDHYKNLEALLERCKQRGLRLNKAKLRLCTGEVKFLGHILTPNGVKSDPEKVDTIKRMLPPKDKTSLQRFLGAVNYHHSFIKDLSSITAPLRELLKKEISFTWGKQQESAFEKLKEALCSEQVLAYYNAEKPVLIRTDASKHAVGAVLIQEERPIDFCSATLRPAEKNYAVIEKELLAILIACEKFQHYIIHHPNVTVETDHQPLMSIFKKPLYDAPKRLQRMLLRLQKYRLTVSYINGKKNTVADWLSRDAPPTNRFDKDTNIQEFIFRTRAEHVDAERLSPVSNKTLNRIRQATKEDPEFSSLKRMIVGGWPRTRDKCNPTLRAFWKFRSDLVHANGLIYKGAALFIPRSLRSEMLRTSHMSHYGFRLQWRRARECIFWPSLKTQLEDFCNSCEACLSFQSKQRKQPMMETTSATFPFQVVFQDLFEFRGKHYLVTVDVFSDFFEVDNLGETATTKKVLQAAKRHFSRYGIPVELHSDNGPQFSSAEFKQFTNDWSITHITSSPYFAQSNGKAEAAVKIAKRLLKKTSMNEEDYEYGLLEIRHIPQPEGVSRAQKFFGRETRTKLPSHPDRNKISDKSQFERNKAKTTKRRKSFNKGSRQLKRLSRGAVVRIQPQERGDTWKSGTCQARVGPRSYNVKLTDGSIIRRNRRHLILTKKARNKILNNNKGVSAAQKGAKPTQASAGNVVAPATQASQRSLLRPARLSIYTPLLDKTAAQTIRRSTRERKPVSRYEP